jgi:hypothetical protein
MTSLERYYLHVSKLTLWPYTDNRGTFVGKNEENIKEVSHESQLLGMVVGGVELQ